MCHDPPHPPPAQTCLLLAEDDEMVLPKYQRLVVGAYAGEKRVIPLAGAHHNDPPDAQAVAQFNAAIEWMLARPNLTH